jgi:hypothetical protein
MMDSRYTKRLCCRVAAAVEAVAVKVRPVGLPLVSRRMAVVILVHAASLVVVDVDALLALLKLLLLEVRLNILVTSPL